MSLSDEIAKLQQLHQDGVLSESEFARAKAQVLGTAPLHPPVDTLRRSRSDRWLGGVCGGIARLTGVESWVWRLLWAFLVFFGGVGLLAYALCWIFVPDENVIG